MWEQNKDFHQALVDEGVDHVTDFYGPGTHIWPYWQRELERFLPQMAAAFAAPPAAPPAVPFSYRSAMKTFSVWDWQFRTGHQVKEFTYLSDVSGSGLSVIGSGTLEVTTAPLYEPGSQWVVTTGGGKPQILLADSAGRLTFAVDLGEPHTVQQYDFGPTATDTWARAEVKLRPAHVPPGCDEAGRPPTGCGRDGAKRA